MTAPAARSAPIVPARGVGDCAKITVVSGDQSPPAVDAGGSQPPSGPYAEFMATPRVLRAFLLACGLAAVALPFILVDLGPEHPEHRAWSTVLLLIVVSALNVEIGRGLAGGLAQTHQPHKALSAWAFSSALLLPTPWLLVVVPVTYLHARLRGIRVTLWRWVGSAAFLVLAGVAAAVTRHLLQPDEPNWMDGNGGRGLVTMVVAAAVFLLVESLLFVGPATLNKAEEETWLRRTLTSRSYYGTEGAVLLIGGLLSAVWTGGSWYVLLFLPIYALAQRAVLHEPLRERAETAAELASKNHELELANQFKIDLMGMLGHEIGNPLTAITGYAQLGSEALQDGGDVRTARSSLEVVERNATQIKTVLREVLAMVSSEGGVLTARRELCLVEQHLDEAAATQPADRRPVVVCEPGLIAFVQPGHLDQILANLLSNAEKYAAGATRLEAAATPAGEVTITVTDAGPGVADGFRGSLFQRFSRDTEAAGRITGTGLGLFISRELARANGGDLHHEEAVPTGSAFVLTLPGTTAA